MFSHPSGSPPLPLCGFWTTLSPHDAFSAPLARSNILWTSGLLWTTRDRRLFPSEVRKTGWFPKGSFWQMCSQTRIPPPPKKKIPTSPQTPSRPLGPPVLETLPPPGIFSKKTIPPPPGASDSPFPLLEQKTKIDNIRDVHQVHSVALRVPAFGGVAGESRYTPWKTL